MSGTASPGSTHSRASGARPSVLLLGVLIIGLLLRLNIAVIDESAQFKDAMQNVRFGLALATTGEFSTMGGEPTMYREPLPIVGIALQLRSDPRLAGVTLKELEADGPAIRAVKQQNLLWASLLLAGVALQSWRLAARSRFAVAAGSVLAVHATFVEIVADRNLSELPAAALIVWAGITAHSTVIGRRLGCAALTGALIGLAALTKASLLYVGALYLVLLALMHIVNRQSRAREAMVGVTVALLLASVVVGPWMVRNAQQFGTMSIADRGGLSIWYRAIYESATPDELRGAWYAFTPLPLRPVAGAILGVSEEDLEGRLRRVHRFHPDEDEQQRSFYSLARIDRIDLTERYLADSNLSREQARVLADRDLRASSVEVLRRDPWFFVATTPMFLWRGTWPVLAAPLLPRPILGLVNPLAMVALLVVGLHAVGARRAERFAVVGLPLGVVAFSALLTMYEPRFTEPALPVMLTLLILGAERAILRVGSRIS